MKKIFVAVLGFFLLSNLAFSSYDTTSTVAPRTKVTLHHMRSLNYNGASGEVVAYHKGTHYLVRLDKEILGKKEIAVPFAKAHRKA